MKLNIHQEVKARQLHLKTYNPLILSDLEYKMRFFYISQYQLNRFLDFGLKFRGHLVAYIQRAELSKKSFKEIIGD